MNSHVQPVVTMFPPMYHDGIVITTPTLYIDYMNYSTSINSVNNTNGIIRDIAIKEIPDINDFDKHARLPLYVSHQVSSTYQIHLRGKSNLRVFPKEYEIPEYLETNVFLDALHDKSFVDEMQVYMTGCNNKFFVDNVLINESLTSSFED